MAASIHRNAALLGCGRVGLPAYQAKRSSAARAAQVAVGCSAGLRASFRPKAQRWQHGRASLGSVGQEAYLTNPAEVCSARQARRPALLEWGDPAAQRWSRRLEFC
jgi:hypothetical protein